MDIPCKLGIIVEGSHLTLFRGAKVAMTVALRSPEHVRNFIAVDNAPIEAQLSSKFGHYVQAMRKIEEAKVDKTRDAMKILEEFESVRLSL